MDLFIRVIILSFTGIIVNTILSIARKGKLKSPPDKIVLKNSNILKGIGIFHLLFWIIICYALCKQDNDLFYLFFLIVPIFAFLYMYRYFIIDKDNKTIIYRNMLFIKKIFSLDDIDCAFNQDINENVILLVNNKIIFVEAEFIIFLRKNKVPFKKNKKFSEIMAYKKHAKNKN